MHSNELLILGGREDNGFSLCLKPKIPFVLTPSLAHEIRRFQNKLAEEYYKEAWERIYCLIWHLNAGHPIWKGFDFSFIYSTLKNSKDSDLECYIDEVFNLLFLNYIGLGLPLINCSIINCPIRGISQDFFFINHINFIKVSKEENLVENQEYRIQPLDYSAFNKLSLPKEIYNRNEYYGFYQMDLLLMRQFIEAINYNPENQEKVEQIKMMFNELKEETIKTLHQMASKNIKLLERMAKKQCCLS